MPPVSLRTHRLALLLAVPISVTTAIHREADASGIDEDVRVVDPDAIAGTGDGQSWANAFTDLQSALAAADGVAVTQIWVADGVYVPGSATASFEIPNGVVVFGGFQGLSGPGGGETDANERDPKSFLTVLSGDNNQDDGGPGSFGDNSVHVVVFDTTTDDVTRLGGFTIEGGRADGSGVDANGGGVLVLGDSQPRITNCVIRGNVADGQGGGIAIQGTGDLIRARPFISNCRITDNQAASGGGVYAIDSDAQIVNTLIDSNTATSGDGGGVWIESAFDPFGGFRRSLVELIGCTIASNSAGSGTGGGVANDPDNDTSAVGTLGEVESVMIKNCVLWGNTSSSASLQLDQFDDGQGGVPTTDRLNLVVRYSSIQGLASGGIYDSGRNVFNTDVDPEFVADFRLDPVDSLLIDQGTRFGVPVPPVDDLDIDRDDDVFELTPDLDESPRLRNAALDLGSYETIADCNDNGVADLEDIGLDPDLDSNDNGAIDGCEDCNRNGVRDEDDISSGPSVDLDSNGIPDECDPDCNRNGVADGVDILNATSEDCNGNGIPDECDLQQTSIVAFLIDGSNSLNLREFEIQKRAIID